jgi:PAS domain S-box-containing protein
MSLRSPATRLAIAFVSWSAVWIVSSDYLLHFLFRPEAAWKLETVKGLVYVAVSGGLLWLSVRAMERDDARRRALNESKLRRLSESGLLAVASQAADGHLNYVNETFARLLGYAYHELIGMDVRNLTPQRYAHLKHAVQSELHAFGKTSLLEVELLRKDGTTVPVIGGRAKLDSPDGEELDYFVDITALKHEEKERELLQEQLLQSEKLNSLGQFAGGVAHNFNNELAVILGYASLLDAKLGHDDALHEKTAQIMKAGERARGVIRQLLAFSRKQPPHRQVVELNQAVLEMRAMLKPLLRENIELRVHTTKMLECIDVDVSQLQQIVLNLVLNARDAMPKGGKLTLAVEPNKTHNDSAEYVTLKVSDTGLGMDDAVKSRIFEPFFTTKQDAGGTGLGLATVHGFVEESNGQISCASKPGEGTTFSIRFPRIEQKAPPPTERLLQAPMKVVGTVLLAEDLDDLRDMLTEVLALKGLRVLPAFDGAEAVKIAKETHEKIDLIVTDVTMPRMTGPEAVKTIRQLRPSVKAIYLSGHADAVTPDNGDLFIAKPVMPEALISTIQECLGDGTKGAQSRGRAA